MNYFSNVFDRILGMETTLQSGEETIDDAPPESFSAVPICCSNLRAAMMSPADQPNDVASKVHAMSLSRETT
jgi:hypothetical protein